MVGNDLRHWKGTIFGPVSEFFFQTERTRIFTKWICHNVTDCLEAMKRFSAK